MSLLETLGAIGSLCSIASLIPGSSMRRIYRVVEEWSKSLKSNNYSLGASVKSNNYSLGASVALEIFFIKLF